VDSVDTILNETARELRETKRPKDRDCEEKRWGRKSEWCRAQLHLYNHAYAHLKDY